MWILFVGSLSSALVHNENSKMIQATNDANSIVVNAPAATNDPVAVLVTKSAKLHESIVSSDIGAYYLPLLEGATSTQNAVATDTSLNTPSDTTDTDQSIFGKLFDLVTNKQTNTDSSYALNTSVKGDGSIIYSSGMICGTICSVKFAKDSSATLVATPGPGSTFSGWSGACTGTGSCVVKMDEAHEVTATFISVAQPQSKTTIKSITESQVATHNTPSDCWIIVSGKVYSVSSYIVLHPGGRSAIVNSCGTDATTLFATRGGTGAHSSTAWSLLGSFLVGALPSSNQPQTPQNTTSGYTFEQVATHAKESDCWIIVSGNVYSVSSYIALHPGGKLNIINVCGKDATTIFITRDGTGAHTSYAWSLLGGYLVGALSSAIPVTPSPAPIPVTKQPQTSSSNEYTLSQVSGHGTKSDCWIIVNNNVYSVGSYISMHPGGTTVIANLCGKEATP
jgi:cytochrome b involved in lipid metabolism